LIAGELVVLAEMDVEAEDRRGVLTLD